MIIEPLTIARNFLSDIDCADTADDCLDALHRAAGQLGWPCFAYGWSPSLRFQPGESYQVMSRGLPSSWRRDWDRHGRHDPYMEHACNALAPFEWSYVIEMGDTLSAKQRDCISYVNDAIGTSAALTIPFHVSGRRPAFVSLIGERSRSADESGEQDAQVIALMRLLGQSLDDKLLGIAGCQGAEDIRLSSRERECMIWSARGKTVEDVAVILDISADTVRVYLKRILSKLQVSNKTHAVAKALALGMIDPADVS